VANQQQQQQAGMNYYDFPMLQAQQNQMMMQQQAQAGLPPYPNGSPQRRFLSEGELLSRTNSNGMSIGTELSYVNRTNNTVDNIRELAGSPQRGVYNWKDQSPPGYAQQPNQMGPAMYPNGSNGNFIGRPPLPTQQNPQQYNMVAVTAAQQQQANVRQSNVSNIINNIQLANNASAYHPALRGGVQVFPPQIPASPQVKRKQTPTRPISFVRALEMANSIEMTNTNYQPQPGEQLEGNKEMNPNAQQTQQIADRGSIYDTNYEISV
jgi:palmitoyltransferase ZDHHC5/8